MTADDRQLPAPQLRETADIWFDSGTDPIICWDTSGRRYWLADGAGGGGTLDLVTFEIEPPTSPDSVAVALRDGLAACDFPPTAPGVPLHRAVATLRAAGIELD